MDSDKSTETTVEKGDSGKDTSKEDVLKQIFGTIGDLIEDFTCAVESTVLLHGRMYITNKFICFYSNLFGLEKKIRIPYSHIKSILKKNTAKVLPNAIAICTDKKDYTFRSFWDRDDCYRILTNFLDKYKYGKDDNSSLHLIQPAATSPSSMSTDTTSSSSFPNSSPPVTPEEATLPIRRQSLPLSSSVVKGELSKRPQSTQLGGSHEELLDFESVDSIAEATATQLGEGAESDDFKQELEKSRMKVPVLTDTLDISMTDFAAVFLGESAPYSFKRYHESVKDTQVSCDQWSDSPLGKHRDLRFFKPVNLPGLKDARGVKIQRFKTFGTYGLLLYSVTKLEDIPAADAFSVDDVMAVTAIGENQVSIEISFQVTFVKSVFFVIKNLIETNTNSEMKKWLQEYFVHLKCAVEQFNNGNVPLDGTIPDAGACAQDNAAAVESRVGSVEVDGAVVASAVPQDNDIGNRPDMPKTLADRTLHVLTEFNSQSLGDKVKLGVLAAFLVFLIVNYLCWRAALQQSSDMHEKLNELEGMLMKLQQTLTSNVQTSEDSCTISSCPGGGVGVVEGGN